MSFTSTETVFHEQLYINYVEYKTFNHLLNFWQLSKTTEIRTKVYFYKNDMLLELIF